MSRPENSLGEALRAWRDRLTTDDVGLPATATLGSGLSGGKRIRHRLVGEIVLDRDVLKVPDHDVRIVTFTAEPGTPAAEKLDFLRTTAVRAAAESGV